MLGVVLDESALFPSEESAQPEIEILRACVPALLTTKGLVVGVSTPYGQRGLVFEKYRDALGRMMPRSLWSRAARPPSTRR
jgi:hypothetical protein